MQTPTAHPSKTGMVVSPHPLATEIGETVLSRGGDAIEAAVAIGTALAVVMPHFCGLGGDAVWLVADREGRSRCFLGIGQAAANPPQNTDSIPLRGPGSMLTTACVVDSWGHALTHSRTHWNGRAALPQLLEPALNLAENGYRPSASQDFWLDFRAAERASWAGFDKLFDHRSTDGPLRQPQLAASLRLLARDGYRSFYEGELAERISRGLAEAGSPLSLGDLAATRTRETAPLTLDYRGTMLLAPPMPTQGCTTLAIMGILARFDMASHPPDTAARYHLLVEATKQAFLHRRHIADPDHADSGVSKETAQSLLDPMRLEAAAKAIDPARALPWPHRVNDADTVFFAVADGNGRCASVLQSTYFDWGSGVLLEDTGILWQNRGAAFSTTPGDPNCLAPGKRPFYTLNPGIALKNDRPHLLYGTQGADGQPQTLSVLLTSLLDDGMTPEQALSRPRFLLGRTFSDSRDTLKVEASLGDDVIDALSRLGHETATLPALSPIFGQAGVVRVDDDGVSGAHDPRGSGEAIDTPLMSKGEP
jgi:oxamate amidohydrolase